MLVKYTIVEEGGIEEEDDVEQNLVHVLDEDLE
jgi:hypothetical protein